MARRAAVLVDAESYFNAVRQALVDARHSVLLLAWDFAERAELDPGQPASGEPNRIGPLLQEITARNPSLNVRVLVWDKAAFLALRRSRLPGVQAAHLNQNGLRYVLDDAHPPLAVHHQKILVIDDALAFCGGMDLAANRWDTRAHSVQDPRRKKPDGTPFEPHHDVMMAVDGDAARALGELARERLWRATGEHLAPAPDGQDPWPDDLVPDFWNVEIGIARTRPAWQGWTEIREVERLYLDAVAAARDTIYIENEYLASHLIGAALARRLSEPGGPEVVLINPKRSPSWAEQVAMDNARTKILHRLRAADRYGRFRLYAALNDGAEIVIHSKLMIVDDRLLRIGSSNLNNRSMGVDTECDLAIEAVPGQAGSVETCRAIRRVRDSLMAEHLGVSRTEMARAVDREGSLIHAIEQLNGSNPRTLATFPAPRPSWITPLEHNRLTDPVHSPAIQGGRQRAKLGLGMAAAALILFGWRHLAGKHH